VKEVEYMDEGIDKEKEICDKHKLTMMVSLYNTHCWTFDGASLLFLMRDFLTT